eukprot:9336454-Pyramimonas_sp.AAC.1
MCIRDRTHSARRGGPGLAGRRSGRSFGMICGDPAPRTILKRAGTRARDSERLSAAVCVQAPAADV